MMNHSSFYYYYYYYLITFFFFCFRQRERGLLGEYSDLTTALKAFLALTENRQL